MGDMPGLPAVGAAATAGSSATTEPVSSPASRARLAASGAAWGASPESLAWRELAVSLSEGYVVMASRWAGSEAGVAAEAPAPCHVEYVVAAELARALWDMHTCAWPSGLFVHGARLVCVGTWVDVDPCGAVAQGSDIRPGALTISSPRCATGRSVSVARTQRL